MESRFIGTQPTVYDGDGFVGEADMDEYDDCNAAPPPTPECLDAFDFDDDQDLDLWDYSVLLTLMDQPAGPAAQACLLELERSTINPYFFTGRRLDLIDVGPGGLLGATTSGLKQLYYYRARHYNPLHGRFIQRDPSGYVDGMNLYEYARSTPTVWGDPRGAQLDQVSRNFWGFNPAPPTPPPIAGSIYTFSAPGNANAAHIQFYLFYTGTNIFRITPAPTDSVIVQGSFAESIMGQGEVLAHIDDVETNYLPGRVRTVLRRLACGDTGAFHDGGSKVVTAQLQSTNVRLTLQSFTAYWESICVIGPKRCCQIAQNCASGYKDAGYYRCNTEWTMYDRYDFGAWNPWGWDGTPFHIYVPWLTATAGTESVCRGQQSELSSGLRMLQ